MKRLDYQLYLRSPKWRRLPEVRGEADPHRDTLRHRHEAPRRVRITVVVESE